MFKKSTLKKDKKNCKKEMNERKSKTGKLLKQKTTKILF